MSHCISCGAPLQPNKHRCQFCGTRNDLDFHAQLPTVSATREVGPVCPDSEVPLEPIDMQASERIRLYRCRRCFGTYFDKGELERALSDPLFKAPKINLELMDNVNADRYRGHKNAVKYRSCPTCRDPMVRRVFGYRSGVTVDICAKHGVWLDNGELIHLMEWSKAGGQDKAMERANEQRKDTSVYRRGKTQRSASFEVHFGPDELTAEALDALLSALRKVF